jgi:hypothetical protein
MSVWKQFSNKPYFAHPRKQAQEGVYFGNKEGSPDFVDEGGDGVYLVTPPHILRILVIRPSPPT